jgi:hypothetical protein
MAGSPRKRGEASVKDFWHPRTILGSMEQNKIGACRRRNLGEIFFLAKGQDWRKRIAIVTQIYLAQRLVHCEISIASLESRAGRNSYQTNRIVSPG